MREARRGPGGGTWGLWFLPQNAKSDRFDPQNLRKTLLIVSRSDGLPFGRIDRIDKPDHIVFHEIDRADSIKRRRFRVEFRGDHPQDLSEPTIVRLYFIGVKRPVVVRFQNFPDR